MFQGGVIVVDNTIFLLYTGMGQYFSYHKHCIRREDMCATKKEVCILRKDIRDLRLALQEQGVLAKPNEKLPGMVCPICLEEVLKLVPICRTPCCHVFHTECILKWLRVGSARSCPLCKKYVRMCFHIPAYPEIKEQSIALVKLTRDCC